MDKLISLNEFIFLKGRMLVDGEVAMNEVIDAKKSRKPCLIFKIDFEKDYDSFSWKFMDYMLVHFNFNDKWKSWIRAYVFAWNITVLINGCLT